MTLGIDLQRQEAIGHDVAGFVERDRTDRAHGPQLGEHAQDALGTPHHVGYERRESIEPFTPGRRRRPRRQPIDHRERERPQVTEIAEIAFETRRAGRVGILAAFLVDLDPIAFREPVEAPMPARRIAADDRGLDDQRFPLPRRPQRAGNDGLLVRVGAISRTRLAVAGRVVSTHGLRKRQHLVVRHDYVGNVLRLVQLRDLGEREIFREAARRELLARACQDGDEGAARRMRASCAALEPGWHARARQRMLEQRDVPLRRADENRHVVERHAAPSLLQDPARDLDRFASFAWRREELDVAARLAFRRLGRGEQIAPQRHEIVVSRLLENLGEESHRFQAIQRGRDRRTVQ